MKVMVVKQFEFEAAHFLPMYDGPCSVMHGHSYKLDVGVVGLIDEGTGMVMDFSELKRTVNEKVVQPLDHSLLNAVSLSGFPYYMPTAENMVVWIRGALDGMIPAVSFIRLWETSTSYAEWRQ